MTEPNKNRKAVHGWVAAEAHAGWHEYAIEHGRTVSAMLDAIGRRLANGETVLYLDQITKQARQIDADNRRRKRDDRAAKREANA